jgi:diguanylate cyclase (GGDEF)-like protein
MDRLDARTTRAMELAQSGSPREAIALVDELLARAAEDDRSDLLPRLHYARAVAHHALGEHAHAIADCDRLLAQAEESGDDGWLSNAHSLRAAQYALIGDIDEAVHDLAVAQVVLERLLSLGVAHDPLVLSFAHTGLAIGFDLLRLYELALPHYEAPLRMVDESGGEFVADRMPEAVVVDHLNLAEFHLRWALELERVGQNATLAAHASSALEHGRAAQREAKVLGVARFRYTADLLTGAALGMTGELADAVDLLRVAVDAVLTLDLAGEASFGLVFLSRALQDMGRLEDAQRAARFAGELLPVDADWSLVATVRERHAAVAAAVSGDPAVLVALTYADTLAAQVWAQRTRTLRGAEAQLTLERLRVDHDAARRASSEDPLTGVANRRELDRRLRELAEQAPPSPYPISAILLDIDHFKSINDRFGHEVGDRALQGVAGAIRREARQDDVAARMGGEEFAILCWHTDLAQAQRIAERLRLAIKVLQIPPIDTPITASIGLAGGQVPLAERVLQEWLQQADSAMYAAKKAGRDRVVVYGAPEQQQVGPACLPPAVSRKT